MILTLTDSIDEDLWLRYLQVTGEPEGTLRVSMEQAEGQLLAQAQPREIHRLLERSELETEGGAIEKHLEDCDRVVVMAVTLGHEVDRLLQQVQATDVTMALLLDTGASVLAEQMAGQAEDRIREEISGYFTPRFSPGYGDYPLHQQRRLLTYTDAGRKLGITLTDTDMMIPRKSITAVMGLSDHPVSGHLATCQTCALREKCDLLAQGTHCW